MEGIARRQIREAAEQLASEAWQRRDIPGELDRIREIRELTRQQLQQDTYTTGGSQRDRIGTMYVGHHDLSGREADDRYSTETDHYSIWREWTEDQLALQAGLSPFLDALQAEDRVLIRLAYDSGLSQREIAEQLNSSAATINRRLKAIHERLRTDLTRAFTLEVKADA